MKKREPNIGMVVFPICETGDKTEDINAANVPFSNLVDILHHLSRDLYILTGDKNRVLFKKEQVQHIYEVQHKSAAGSIGRIIKYAYTQVKLSIALAKMSKNVNLWVFFIGSEALILPMLTAKLWRRRVVLALSGFPAWKSKEETTILFKVVNLFLRMGLVLANRIIVYSERNIDGYNLGKYRRKISIASEHFLDFNLFNIRTPIVSRENLVAYIGRLSEGKGVPSFLDAIEKLSSSRNDISFLIGGDGPLRKTVEDYGDRSKYVGWIPHNELPSYLNQIKLLVLPSYTEALPNIVLEAMACGTLVLTTTVGAIPDLIKDGETGFLMEEISAECIARNIIRAIDHPNLAQISENARTLVTNTYTYEAAVARYLTIKNAITC